MKKHLLVVILISVCFSSNAQDFIFGDISNEEINYDISKIDQNAKAVVLKEYGETRFDLNEFTNELLIKAYYHVRIKIIDPEGYKHANIGVHLYNETGKVEYLSNLKASTFNMIDGRLDETVLAAKILVEETDKYNRIEKFTMPNLRPGAIIEYSYLISSPLAFNFRNWDFQGEIPKLHSEYTAIIPPIYNYNITLTGPLKLSKNSSSILPKCIVVYGSEQDCSKMVYIMENIPAFIEESHMTAASNYRSRIKFELMEIVRVGSVQKVTTNWPDVEGLFKNDKTFGTQIRRNGIFKDKLPGVLSGLEKDLDKAKAVYNFIKKEIKWNNYLGYSSQDNIKKAYETKSGNVGDINISLISALNDAGLNAEAVVLSTRNNGMPNKLYPVVSDFNYVVAKVVIDNKTYLLDATDPYLQFGMLPLRALNDQGRVISMKNPSYWIDIVPNQVNNSSIFLDAIMKDGKIVGKLNITSIGYSAYNRRSYINRYGALEDFIENFDESLNNMKIINHKIENLHDVEEMLNEEYDVEISYNEDEALDNISITPVIFNKISKNPYNLSQRTYPIDIGWPYSEQQILRITLPDKYELVDKPQNVSLSIPENASQYIIKSDFANNILSVDQAFKMNRSIYEPEFYSSLKELYNKVIQIHKSELIFKIAK